MKRFISILLTLSIIFCTCTCLSIYSFAQSGTVYYIDSENGNDENDGLSENTAWASLATHSSHSFQPGDSILLKAGGIYTGLFIPESSGTAENPITISSYGNAESDGRPVMMSLDKYPTIALYNVSGWSINGLEFTAKKDGAGIVICANNTLNPEKFSASEKEDADEDSGKSFFENIIEKIKDTFEKIKKQ